MPAGALVYLAEIGRRFATREILTVEQEATDIASAEDLGRMAARIAGFASVL